MALDQPVAMVVEDNELISVSTEVQLEDLGFRTFAAASAEQALAQLRSERSINVLVADLGLGAEPYAGLTLAMEALTIRPDLAVVYMTGGRVKAEMQRNFVKRSEFLHKPFSPEQLRAAITTALAKTA